MTGNPPLDIMRAQLKPTLTVDLCFKVNPLCFAVYFIHLLISRCDDMGRNIQLPFAVAICKMPFGNNFQVQQHIGQTKGR